MNTQEIMKKIAFILALMATPIVASSFINTTKNAESKNIVGDICFKIKNDSGSTVTFHTGKGTTAVNNGITREFCIPEGKSLHLADKGQKGKAIVTASAKVSGKTFKLSEL